MELFGRDAECRLLKSVLESVRGGRSHALVMVGDGGVGKTALLDHLAKAAGGCHVMRVAGIEAESSFAFAALHHLCAPLMSCASELPRPQHDALLAAFGLAEGPRPNGLHLGLAVLGLFSARASGSPLLCLVDDQQWLDHASSQILAFVARRLVAESVALIFATRAHDGDVADLPTMTVTGLHDDDSYRLLDRVLPGRIDAGVRHQIVAEAQGNPLALIELPRMLTPAELAGGYGLPAAVRISGSLEEAFRRRLEALPDPTRHLLVLAAAESSGNPSLVWRAARLLDIDADAAIPAVDAGVVSIGMSVRFRHPLLRTVAYQSTSDDVRRAAHNALARVVDGVSAPDRRAWHRGHAATGPDDAVADELECCAARAESRGGVAAAAAFLERAAELTAEPTRRADRAIAAAGAKVRIGATDEAKILLDAAEALTLDEFQRAGVDLTRARVAFVTNRGNDAAQLLLRAAGRLEDIDVRLARDTYLEALSAAVLAGRMASGRGVLDVARAACAAPRPVESPLPIDLLLDGMATCHVRGFADGLPLLRAALDDFEGSMSEDQELRWLWLACVAAAHTWDEAALAVLSARHVELVRHRGELGDLPLALNSRALWLFWRGELDAADKLLAEFYTVLEVTGNGGTPYPAVSVAGLRGHPATAQRLITEALDQAGRHGEGVSITVAYWAEALLHNGLGEYAAALNAATQATAYTDDYISSAWSTVELVEAAARVGDRSTAERALGQLSAMTTPSATDWSLGVEARCRALVVDDHEAETWHRESVERLSRTCCGPDLARAHLLYGEWLRRKRRRLDARVQLRIAHRMFGDIGMAAFADRANREPLATGETARKRTAAPDLRLTAQEAQIARLARDGLSNPEIGARLFISTRTVQYHLSKVFTKLGIRSRSQLATVSLESR